MATDGLRGYLALNGKLKLEKVYQSYATYPNAKLGGYQGRRLQKGDHLEWEPMPFDPFANEGIPLRPGPEFDLLTEESKRQLAAITYTISNASNRMGLRLHGPVLTSTSYQLEHSLPVLPGFVQLPPSGLPIVILQDGQLSGGYPRIAYVEPRFLSILNQVPLGGEVRLCLASNF
jgi:allophanate hydrolase subunit 2